MALETWAGQIRSGGTAAAILGRSTGANQPEMLSSGMTTFGAALADREPRVVRHIRRALVAIACLYAVCFCWSIYRRLHQILVVEARASNLTLRPGATVGYRVVTSGEVKNEIRLELIQGSLSELLLTRRADVNHISGLDPRVFDYASSIVLTSAQLARFHAGPATLRVTGVGGQKLLQTPPPRTSELRVQLQP